MTNEEIIARRAEVRQQLADVEAKKTALTREEWLRHQRALNEAHTQHRDNLTKIEAEARTQRLILREELDRLGQSMRTVCPMDIKAE
jgi:uncharacterized protein YicC (UPF0701 family)